VKVNWETAAYRNDSALMLNGKFKKLRVGLKKWSRSFSNLTKIITKCNYTLALLDGLEDQRRLSTVEKNFQRILNNHTRKLLEAKRIYWKNRAKIRWATLGDENTKYFHTIATKSYRRNLITSIKAADGSVVYNHDHKAAIIWESYKERLGVSENAQMHINLENIIHPRDLAHLDTPFTREEIDDVIKEFPTDKAPGPDGFNGKFMKRCWQIIKEDFYKLIDDFYNEKINLESINTAFITLIPKVADPENMNDFRPISLVSLPLKIITKLMANRMQKEIISLVHQNQYGFIKGRNIQDCLGWTFEYLHICHLSKRPIIILKIDFEKAFDKVDYNAVISMLRARGFGQKWIKLVSNILHSASTSVLLNGVPGKKIICKRGVRQGDPLSPILFVNTADLLQSAINDAWQNGIINLPLADDFGQKFPIVQYADDTLMIMPADNNQLIHLKNILQIFSASTGLHVNYHKTTLVPINIDNARATELANIFGCKVESCPLHTWGYLLVQQGHQYLTLCLWYQELIRSYLEFHHYYLILESLHY
jgi:hypothetical protein